MNEWIKCSERLPDDEEQILISDGTQIAMGWFMRGTQQFLQINTWVDLTFCITHWMPLPSPPEDE